MKEPDFIPDRLNEQPPVMRGCSWPEIYSIITRSFIYGIPLSLLLSVYLDNYTTLLAATPVFAGVFFWILTGRMARLKNGRPIGYFEVKSNLAKQKRGGRKVFIISSGYWKISKD